MSEHFRTEGDLRATPYSTSSTSSAVEYLSKLDGRYGSTRNYI